MSRRQKFTSKFPLDTLDDSRSFMAAAAKAFRSYDDGEGASQAFSEMIATLGYFPIDGDQWVELRSEFITLAEDTDGSPESKTARLVNERCDWLESPYIKGLREAEKRPAPRDGKQPPIPSPFAR